MTFHESLDEDLHMLSIPRPVERCMWRRYKKMNSTHVSHNATSDKPHIVTSVIALKWSLHSAVLKCATARSFVVGVRRTVSCGYEKHTSGRCSDGNEKGAACWNQTGVKDKQLYLKWLWIFEFKVCLAELTAEPRPWTLETHSRFLYLCLFLKRVFWGFISLTNPTKKRENVWPDLSVAHSCRCIALCFKSHSNTFFWRLYNSPKQLASSF